jgi:hypothetical protein
MSVRSDLEVASGFACFPLASNPGRAPDKDVDEATGPEPNVT